MEDLKFITIKNDLIIELTPKELTILMLISMHSNVRGQYIFTIDNILKLINLKNTTREQKIVKDLLIKLNNFEYIEIYNNPQEEDEYLINDISSIGKNDFVYMSKLPNMDNGDSFTIIYDYEIFKILNYNDEPINNYLLLQLFSYIIRLISNNALSDTYLLSYPSYKDFNEKLGLSDGTISKYIDILQDIDLIRCDYAGIEQLLSGKIKNTKMYYCRTKDEQALIDRIEFERKENGFIKVNNKSRDDSNLKRSITQRINKLETKLRDNTITETEIITLKELKDTP